MDNAPPLYGDPFEGICRYALALPPGERARVTQNCPRCGPPAIRNPADGCLLEGLELALKALPGGPRRD